MILFEIHNGIIRYGGQSIWLDKTHFHAENNTFTFIRQFGDTKRLYYFNSGSHFIISDSLSDFSEVPSLTINNRALKTVRLLGYCFPPDTLFEQINQIPLGAYLHVTNDDNKKAICARLVLKPIPEGDVLSSPDTIIRTIRNTIPNKASLLFSGGIDSTLLAVVCPERYSNYFATGFEFNDEDYIEKRYALSASQAINIQVEYISSPLHILLESLPSIIAITEEPICHIQTLLLYGLMQMVKDRSEVVFINGQGADAIYGTPPGILDFICDNNISLPESLQSFINERYDSGLNINYYLNLIGDVDHTAVCWGKCAEALGKKMVYPFLNSQLLKQDVSYSKTHKDKSILKESAKKLGVPDWILHRPKASFGPVSTDWGEMLGMGHCLPQERYKKWNSLNLELWCNWFHSCILTH